MSGPSATNRYIIIPYTTKELMQSNPDSHLQFLEFNCVVPAKCQTWVNSVFRFLHAAMYQIA